MRVTWLPESSNEGILLLPQPIFTLGHVAMALCIMSNLTWAETFWLVINLYTHQFILDCCQIGLDHCLCLLDCSNIWEVSVFWNLRPCIPALALFGSHCLLLHLDVPCSGIIEADTVIFSVPFKFTIIAGHSQLECPIGTTCQLGLSWSASIVRIALVLSGLWCFGALFHGDITNHYWYGLN